MNKSVSIFVGLLFSFFLPTASIAGDKYEGVWSGAPTDTTSIEILSEDPLKITYCSKDDCEEWAPEGSTDKMTMILKPNGNFMGATVTFQLKFGKYVGEYHHADDRRTFASIQGGIRFCKGREN